jgi:subtilisin family serine protease
MKDFVKASGDQSQSHYSKLRPTTELLREQYPDLPELVENYQQLAVKDPHLAELYRLSQTGQTEAINPVQAVLDDEGQVWVEVVAEITNNETFDWMYKFMRIRSHTGSYVTGQILAEALPTLVANSRRIQAARPIGAALYQSVKEIEADPDNLAALVNGNELAQLPDGRDVIVGVVDFGCDFKHPSFRQPGLDGSQGTGESRILFLWDQRKDLVGVPPEGFGVGREFTQAEINNALTAPDPYTTLGYEPEPSAHGTHVMSIAAGSYKDWLNNPGVAPAADLIFVHCGLPGKSVSEKETETLGCSTFLIDAVAYIFQKAADLGRPAVVNLSLAANGGPHDGQTLLEAALDQLLQEAGRAVVIAAGNSYQDQIHLSNTVTASQEGYTLKWYIKNHALPNAAQQQEIEIWYDNNTELELEIQTPSGSSLGTCHLNETKTAMVQGTSDQGLQVFHHPSSLTNKNHINLFLDDRLQGLPLGHWLLILRLVNGSQPVGFNAWIERNDSRQSAFEPDQSVTDSTLNTIGNGRKPLVVGAYNSRSDSRAIALYSAAGPSLNSNGPDKPDLSAPGDHIVAAQATQNGVGAVKSGTSMAAPHVTGVIALLMQVAWERGQLLTAETIRQILLETVDHNPPSNGYDQRYGHGRVNGCRALEKLLQLLG